MKRLLFGIFLVGVLLIGTSTFLLAQGPPQWKVGDKIEILNLSKEWAPGTVIGTVDGNGKLLYRVQLDDPNAPVVYFNHTDPADIRSRGGQRAVANQPAETAIMPNASAAFKVGDRVDTFYDQAHGHNRGNVTEVGDRRYKVHYNGCKTDEWVDASLVRPGATISALAPEIAVLFGKWRTTTVAVGGNYAVWGKSPGIEINPDGTYVWYQFAGRPPIKGQWTPEAKVPGIVEGTPKFDGVIVKDADGNEWKAFEWIVKGDPNPGIEIDQLCLGMSEVGSRVR